MALLLAILFAFPCVSSASITNATDLNNAMCPGFEGEALDTDMAATLMASFSASDSSECCALCDEAEGCEGFAFAHSTCYLKKDFSGTYHQAGVVTRLKVVGQEQCESFGSSEEGKDLAGRLLEDWQSPASEMCCLACGRRSDCQGFVFHDERCYLKADVTGTYAMPGRVAQVKEGVLSSGPSSSVPIVAPSCPSFESELADTDMSGSLIASVSATDISQCCVLCEEAEGCEGFSYAYTFCYLKKDFAGTYHQAGVVTRLRVASQEQCGSFGSSEEGKDLAGRLLEDWQSPSSEMCCLACGRRSDCQGFVFDGERCYLKADVTGTYAMPGRVAQVKEGVFSSGSSSSLPTLSFESELADTDMSGTLIASVSASDISQCCALCEEAEGCEGFAFAHSTCFLKTDFSGTYQKDGVVTRLRVVGQEQCESFGSSEEGKDLAGRLLEDWQSPSSEMCCLACGRRSDCQGFVFFDNRCYLKTDVQGTYDSLGRIAYVKSARESAVGGSRRLAAGDGGFLV